MLIFTFYFYLQKDTQAQSIPPVIPQPNQPEIPPPIPQLPEIKHPPLERDHDVIIPPERVPGHIWVKKFNVINNEILSPEEIAEIVKPYTLRPISLIELLEVPRKITQLYVKKGYITTSASILPQTISDRTITIKVFPGTIEDIKISGLKQLNSQYIKSRLAKAVQPPFNQNQLLAALQLLQVNPLIDNITAELSTGIAPNSSLLEVKITEADTFNLGLILDNSQVTTVGTFNRKLELTENNLLGFGDRFYLLYSNTEGSNALNNLSYELPINANNGKIKFTHSRASNKIIQNPFKQLNIENKTTSYEITYTQPLLQSIYQELTIGFNFTRKSSETTYLEGEIFPNTVGATNPEGETIITTIGFFQDYLKRNEKQVFFARSQFILGLDTLDSVVVENKPDSEFVAWRGYTEYLRSFSPRQTLSVKGNIQLANDDLVPLEKFSAGGFYSVRGYPQNVLLGDNGIFISTEMAYALIKNKNKNITLEIIPFIDLGKVWNTKIELEESVNTLAAVGTSLKLSLDNNLTARIDWGIPLIKIESSGDSLQENGIYFSLQSNF